MTQHPHAGQTMSVEGTPWTVPYVDAQGCGLDPGDAVLFPSDRCHLRRGRLVSVDDKGVWRIEALDGPLGRRPIYRHSDDLVYVP
jgi:hypothetical protein